MSSPTQSTSRDIAPRAFPAPGTTLHNLIYNPEFKQTFHARLKQSNRWVILFYKLGVLPLLGMGKQIMLLTTKGRKSNARRDFPIGYFRIDDTIYVFSAWGKDANWYKNLMADPEQAYTQIGFRHFQVHPKVVVDPDELKRVIRQLVLQDPAGARQLMGWDSTRDDIETADLTPMVERVLVVRFSER